MRRAAPLLTALLLGACGAQAEGPLEDPPSGMPWLARRFDVSRQVVSSACPGRDGAWPPGFSVATLEQDGTQVTLTFEAPKTDPTVHPLPVRGCLVKADAGGFRLRLRGANRATIPQGAASCTARLALPAAVGEERDRAEAAVLLSGEAASSLARDEDTWLAAGCPAEGGQALAAFELAVCEDGHLEGVTDAQLAHAGQACHAGAPCTMYLQIAAVVLSPHPKAPAGALLGGPCGPGAPTPDGGP